MSDTNTESFRKVAYDLRPAKQVERRMLLDALQLMHGAGLPIRDYQYTGMGSIFFVDYLMLHRYLGISKMVSVEISTKIRKRVTFNRPFAGIDIQIDEIGNVIPNLSKDRRHILWLDYDARLRASQLRDVAQAVTQLSAGSLLLVTVDVEPPGDNTSKPSEWRQYFLNEAAKYLPPEPPVSDFARTKLTTVVAKILATCIDNVANTRPDLRWVPLFSFNYADGHEMLTVGGMLAAPDDERKLAASELFNATYFRNDLTHLFRIKVPNLTRKERVFLDAAMPCANDWIPEHFELTLEEVADYLKIYRFMPVYAELYL